MDAKFHFDREEGALQPLLYLCRACDEPFRIWRSYVGVTWEGDMRFQFAEMMSIRKIDIISEVKEVGGFNRRNTFTYAGANRYVPLYVIQTQRLKKITVHEWALSIRK